MKNCDRMNRMNRMVEAGKRYRATAVRSGRLRSEASTRQGGYESYDNSTNLHFGVFATEPQRVQRRGRFRLQGRSAFGRFRLRCASMRRVSATRDDASCV